LQESFIKYAKGTALKEREIPGMERKSDRPDDKRTFTLEGVTPRKTDIMQLVERSIREIQMPDTIHVTMRGNVSDPFVWIDDERILKALVNLETNAVEAMPQGGDLSISVEGNNEQVVITIQDTGTGISRENMDNIFIPFFTTKPTGEGTGLGLPAAYGAVKLHSGKITVESNADPGCGPTGTKITIVLPRRSTMQDLETRLIIHDDDE
jgi:signal transduction histidine kinase